MKTLIAIPCMDMVHTNFMKSLVQLKRVGDVRFSISCSSLVYDARNTLARQAVAEGFDRMLWFDSDMDFNPELMELLSSDMDDGKDFVSGLYFKRKAPIKPVLYKEVGYYHNDTDESVTPVAIPFEDYPQDSVFEIAGAGFGGCMVSVDLVKRVTEKHGLPFSPILGFGEDLSFCVRARDIGATLWCDSRVKMGHVGYGVITEETYIQTR